jgi:uncharacterized Zn-finger protein
LDLPRPPVGKESNIAGSQCLHDVATGKSSRGERFAPVAAGSESHRGPLRAGVRDAAAITAFLHAHNVTPAPSVTDLEAALVRPDTAFFVERKHGTVCGVIGCTLDGDCAHLHHFEAGAPPDEQRAVRLVHAACRYARAAGATIAAASVEDGSRAAILLQRLGFDCDTRENEVAFGRPGIWLELVAILDRAE